MQGEHRTYIKRVKSALGQIVGFGVSPRVLIARIAVLRSLKLLPQPRVAPTKEIKRIFFSIPYHRVGDVVLSFTLLDRIHDRWPDAEIDVAVGSSMGSLVGAIPYVERVFPLKQSGIRNQRRIAAYLEIRNATRLFKRDIAGIDYDMAVAPRWDSFDSFFSAHLAYLTGAPIRCGYSGRSDGGSAEVDRFYTVAGAGGATEHESLRYAQLLSRCGLEASYAENLDAPERPIRALQQIAASRLAAATAMRSPVSGQYAVLSPGATKSWHIWPASRFAEIGRVLYVEYGIRSLIVGSPQDLAICTEVSDRIGSSAILMAGKTNVLQLLDLVTGAALFLGNDSGPGHIAGGLGIKTIVVNPYALMCPMDYKDGPQRWKPPGKDVHMLQPEFSIEPCIDGICRHPEAHCILQVSTEQVLAVLRRVMEHHVTTV